MNELNFKLQKNEDGSIAVSGRELHEKLEIKTEYKKWFNRMKKYGFEETLDFVRVNQKCPTLGGQQERKD